MSQERRIVVAAEDARGFEGEVSGQLGRCPFLLLADVEGRMATVSQVVPNPHVGSHPADALPGLVRDLGADVVIAGGMGPGAIQTFHDFGIDVATGVTGTVSQVLGAYLRGDHSGLLPCTGGRPEGGLDEG